MNASEAADQIRTNLTRFRGLYEAFGVVAELLERVGSLDRAAREMEGLKDAAESRLGEVNAQVAGAQAVLKELQDKTAGIRAAESALAKSAKADQDAMRAAFEADIAGKRKELAAITDQLESARHKVATMLEFAKAS